MKLEIQENERVDKSEPVSPEFPSPWMMRLKAMNTETTISPGNVGHIEMSEEIFSKLNIFYFQDLNGQRQAISSPEMDKNSTVQDSLEVDTNPDYLEKENIIEKIAQALDDLYFEPDEEEDIYVKCKKKVQDLTR